MVDLEGLRDCSVMICYLPSFRLSWFFLSFRIASCVSFRRLLPTADCLPCPSSPTLACQCNPAGSMPPKRRFYGSGPQTWPPDLATNTRAFDVSPRGELLAVSSSPEMTAKESKTTGVRAVSVVWPCHRCLIASSWLAFCFPGTLIPPGFTGFPFSQA